MSLVGEGLAVATAPGPVDMAALAKQAAGQALGALGSAANLALVFVAADNADDCEQAMLAAQEALAGATVVGTSAAGVIASGRGTDQGVAVAVWAARLPGLRARSFHLEVMAGPEGHRIVGLPGRRRDDVIAVVFTDPWSFPTEDFAAHCSALMTDLPVIGAVASGPAPARTTRFLLDGRIHRRGAVGVMLGGHVEVTTMVSPACRPVGPILTVTDVEGFLLKSLAGTPAALRAQEVIAGLEGADRSLGLAGMQLGLAVTDDEPRIGDFVIHEFEAAEGERGALQVSGAIPLGATVQFHVRDERSADEDLNLMLEGISARMGDRMAGALMFSSTARGRFMFAGNDHDSAVASGRLRVPVTGFFADGELACIGSQTHLNRETATIVVVSGGPAAQPGHSQAVRPRQIADPDPMVKEIHEMLNELSQPPDEGLR